jgi:hypothetical protein
MLHSHRGLARVEIGCLAQGVIRGGQWVLN